MGHRGPQSDLLRFPRGPRICKFRVRIVREDVDVAPMVGAQNLETKMTKTPTMNARQQREAARIAAHGAVLGADYMARGLSALYRSAMRTSQQHAILAFALAYPGVVTSNEWIG